MRQRAVVVEVHGEYATVETSRRTMCDGCAKGGGCGGHCEITGLVASNGKMRAEVENKLGAKVGDTVEIESESGVILSYAALVFILPIAVCALFYYVTYSIFGTESAGVIGAAAGFVLCFARIAVFDRTRKNKKKDIKIVEIKKYTDE